MASRPTRPAKNIEGDFGQFTDFMRQLVKVPHTKIKAQMETEKAERQARPKRRVSRVSASS